MKETALCRTNRTGFTVHNAIVKFVQIRRMNKSTNLPTAELVKFIVG